MSWPPREPGLLLGKDGKRQIQRVPACKSLTLQNRDEVDKVGLQDEKVSSTLHLAQALNLTNTSLQDFFFFPSHPHNRSGKSDLRHIRISGNLFIVFGSDTKDDCVYPGALEHPFSYCCPVLPSPQAQSMSILEVQPFSKACHC